MSDVSVFIEPNTNNILQAPPIVTDGNINLYFKTSKLTPYTSREVECGGNFISDFQTTILWRCKISGSIVINKGGFIVLVDPFTYEHLGNKVIQGGNAVLIKMSQEDADALEKKIYD